MPESPEGGFRANSDRKSPDDRRIGGTGIEIASGHQLSFRNEIQPVFVLTAGQMPRIPPWPIAARTLAPERKFITQ
jgi:hypothetical protein